MKQMVSGKGISGYGGVLGQEARAYPPPPDPAQEKRAGSGRGFTLPRP
ncbi:MAG: hypothetical protein M0R18_06125 [Deltaproteobacteria bacterium]|nr:hypothetical protein [Deltaproteobacteria bacterium]